MAEVDALSGIFVEIGNFREAEEDFFDYELKEGAPFRYEVVDQIEPEEKAICKIFNPELLEKNKSEGSPDKTDQCWYRQLQLMREVIFLKELRHPTIIGFKGFNLYNDKFLFQENEYNEGNEPLPELEEETNTNPTIFLDYHKNKSLQSYIERKEQLPAVKRQICMIGLAAALRYIHKKKIIHRGLNPNAIWLDENYYPKIFDFSTSRECFQRDIKQTYLGTNSFRYQSPEVLGSEPFFDDSVDVYSLGRLMYYFITGSEPFRLEGDPYRSKNQSKIETDLAAKKAIPTFPPGVSQELKDLLIRCWDNNPSNRPTAAEIYYYLTTSKEYLISEIDPNQDLPEINRYIDMIIDFELNNTSQKLDVQESLFFEVPDENQDTTPLEVIPSDPAKQQQKLVSIISTNFAASLENEVFPLLFAMAKSGSLYEGDYLPQIMNLINDLCSRGNQDAEKFMKEVFGGYVVPNDVKIIKLGTIDSKVEKVNIPPWVTKIEMHAFSGFSNLLRVNVPNSVKIIEDEAFSACQKLRYVNLPESLEKDGLGNGVFKGCTSLRYIKIPSKITVIKKCTFLNNKELKTVVLNKNLEEIGKSAFDGCKKLPSIELPKSVKLVSSKAFHDCDRFSTVYLRGPKNKVKFERGAIKWNVEKVELI